MNGTSRDDILYGALSLEQPESGPRVTTDTILLAAYVRNTFVRRGKEASLLEMGCASGAIALILALRFPEIPTLRGMDIQGDLVAMARRNARRNGLHDRLSFMEGDIRRIREHFPPQSFRAVVMNPPYEEPGRGRPCASETAQTARQGGTCSIGDVADAAHYLLGSHGRLYLVFKAERASEVLTTLTSRKIEPKRLRFVHPKPGRRASVFLVDSIRGGRPGLVVEPPLFIEKEEGGYTEDFLRAYTKEGLSCPSR